MAGKRMLHSNICESEKLSKISYEAETLYYRLMSKADDDGNFTANPRIILGQCMPLREDQTPDKIAKLLEELTTVINGDKQPLISLYEAGGEKFLHINRFQDFQYLRPDRTAVAACPTHPEDIEPSILSTRKEEGLPVAFNSYQPQSSGRYTPGVLSGKPSVKTGLPFSEMVGSNQIKSNQSKSNESKESGSSNFKTFSIRYRRAFGKPMPHGRMQREEYAEACAKFGEGAVLEQFDVWQTANQWVREDRYNTNGLKKFYAELPDLVEEAEEVAEDASPYSDLLTPAPNQAINALRENLLASIKEETEAAERIQENPDSLFGGNS